MATAQDQWVLTLSLSPSRRSLLSPVRASTLWLDRLSSIREIELAPVLTGHFGIAMEA